MPKNTKGLFIAEWAFDPKNAILAPLSAARVNSVVRLYPPSPNERAFRILSDLVCEYAIMLLA